MEGQKKKSAARGPTFLNPRDIGLLLTLFLNSRLQRNWRTPRCWCRTFECRKNPRPPNPIDSADRLGYSQGRMGNRRVVYRSRTTRGMGRSRNCLQRRLRSRHDQRDQAAEAPNERSPESPLPVLRSHRHKRRDRMAGEAQEDTTMGKLR